MHQSGKPVVQLHTKPFVVKWLFYKSRSISVVLHRLKSGHNNLNALKHRIDNDDPAALGAKLWKTQTTSSFTAPSSPTTGTKYPNSAKRKTFCVTLTQSLDSTGRGHSDTAQTKWYARRLHSCHKTRRDHLRNPYNRHSVTHF